MEEGERIDGDGVVLVRRTRHRVDGAAEVFMLHIADFLAREIILMVMKSGCFTAVMGEGSRRQHATGSNDHVPGDVILRGAARALDADEIGVAEKFVEPFAPAAEDGQDLVERAAAEEAELAGFEQGGFLGLGDFFDVGDVK